MSSLFPCSAQNIGLISFPFPKDFEDRWLLQLENIVGFQPSKLRDGCRHDRPNQAWLASYNCSFSTEETSERNSSPSERLFNVTPHNLVLALRHEKNIGASCIKRAGKSVA